MNLQMHLETCVDGFNQRRVVFDQEFVYTYQVEFITCLLYTSDAADDLLCVDLGGSRIIKKKKNKIDSILQLAQTTTSRSINIG